MDNRYIKYIETPLGTMEILSTSKGITDINFLKNREPYNERKTNQDPNAVEYAHLAAVQLTEYFDGKRTTFDIPLHLEGTSFQRRVWKAMLTIPYGHTASYGEIAIKAGSPKAFRAAGGACGKNPISIIIPCHRIIASNGKIGGFSSGLHRKKWLLQHEAKLQR